MSDRDRLIELLKPHVSGTACLCESGSCELTSCRDCKARRLSDYLLANGVIVLPCKVGDKVAVRALCECVHTLPIFEECRNECPFEDDCPCEECDNGNERIFVTRIDRIFNDGYGWKFEFRYLSVEASLNDLGVSFFVGDDAEQQAVEYEQVLKEREKVETCQDT